jgi:putative sensory transduction regulator
MSAFIDFAERRFSALGIEAKLSEDRKFVVLRQEAEGANLLVILHEDNNLMLASFSPGVRVPEEKLPAMREFICAANARLRFGSLDLARDNQELSFKIANLLYSPDFTEDLLRKIMATGVQTTVAILKGVSAILDDGASCEEALQRLA